MRKAMADQVRALRAQLHVSEEMVEAQEKPCLALYINADPSHRKPQGDFIAGTMLTAYADGRIGLENRWAMGRR